VTIAGLAPGVTLGAARHLLADALRAKRIDTPELDARLLAGHALNLDHAALTASADRTLDGAEMRELEALAARRIGGEPVARITGVKEFWGLPLRVTAATLVPRPDTETLVEAALAAIDSGGSRARALRVADLGTGSGALLLALLTELPNAFGTATDISAAALVAARDNARHLKLDARARFVACDFGAALKGDFDLVVVNPPYIASGDIPGLPAEVRHDPRLALDGGADGLACYRAIAPDAQRLMAPAGHIVVELGIGQEAAVAALFKAAGLETLPARADLSGIARALPARVATMPQ
jgi:release factor glutamine methyltransferase